MRSLILAACVLAPASALAAPHSDSPIADALPSGGEVARYGEALNGLIGALLTFDIGPLADAVHPERPEAGSRQSLGELARKRDPGFDERLRESVGALAGRMDLLKEHMRRAEPGLRRSLRELERSIDEAVHELPEFDEYKDRP